jgi:pilus assembly protein Flp/PilA
MPNRAQFSSIFRLGPYLSTTSDPDNAARNGAPTERAKQMSKVLKFFRDERGATAIEYGLIAAGISVVIIGAVQLVGTNLKATFNSVAAAV